MSYLLIDIAVRMVKQFRLTGLHLQLYPIIHEHVCHLHAHTHTHRILIQDKDKKDDDEQDHGNAEQEAQAAAERKAKEEANRTMVCNSLCYDWIATDG